MLPGMYNPIVRGGLRAKIVATLPNVSTIGTSHTFTGVTFGSAHPSRILVACIGLMDTGAASLNQLTCTIGGVATSGDDRGEFLPGGPAAGAGLWYANVPVGGSGSIFVDWSGQTAPDAALVLVSIIGCTLPAFDEDDRGGAGGGGASMPAWSINVSAGGVVILSAGRSNGSGAGTTWVGVTKRADVAMGSGTLMVAFDKNLPAPVLTPSTTWSGSSARGGFAVSLNRS